jgi:hypothetical protein
MTLLEDISQMKTQGISENEIVKKLQDQGVSPRSINDALNQASIKNAVSNENDYQEYEVSPKASAPQSKIDSRTQEISEEESYIPQENEGEYPAESYPQDQQYQDEYGYDQGSMDTNTIIEISEQVFSEKVGKIQKNIDEVTNFKNLTESKITDISNRLTRIESTIEKLQTSILQKVGSYGGSLEGMQKEMSMMQDSFSKIINPLADKAVERKFSSKIKTKNTIPAKKSIKKVKKN